MINQEKLNYYEGVILKNDLLKESLEYLELNLDDVNETISTLTNIKSDIEKEINNKRKDIIILYGILSDYINLIEDNKNELNNNIDSNEINRIELENEIEEYIDEINKIYNSIENINISLNSYINSINFVDEILKRI